MKRAVRVWLPAAIVLLGLILIAVRPNEDGIDGGAMVVGAGLAVWLLNLLYRLGVSGDRERDQEDRARAYFDEHGVWPDEAPPGPPEPGGASPHRPRANPHGRAAAHQPRRRG
jgi:hypothetical protein